jgi:HprK-related kinase B
MTEKAGSVNDILKELMRRETPEFTLSLEFGECVTEVRSNSQELIEKLKDYFKGFLGGARPDISVFAFETGRTDFEAVFRKKDPEQGKTKIKEEYADLSNGRIVKKIATGMHFIFGKGINIAAGECVKNYNQVVNFINNRYIERMLKRGCMLMHASGVVLKGRGMAIAGFSGMGKSTLALALMNRGFKFLSNDRLLIKKYGEGLRMFGIPKLPRINPGTILSNPALDKVIPPEERVEFEKIPAEEMWETEHKYDVDISGIFGADRFVLSAEMKILIILNWNRNSSEPFSINGVDLKERPDLVQAYMKLPGLFFEMSEDSTVPDFSQDAYIAGLNGCRVFEITGTVDFEEASERCIEALEAEAKQGSINIRASK